MRIAIMQPYFIPYAGYFRLFASSDLFVIYDCVQFIRRGYIHRNQLLNSSNALEWLTLPLAKASQDIKINHIQFSEDAESRMDDQCRKFPLFASSVYQQSEFANSLKQFAQSPLSYITQLLRLTCERLKIPCNICYSSDLQIPMELKGQDRILAIAKHFGASVYVNAAGGTSLYDEETFKKCKIELKFLSPYQGSYESILPRLFTEDITSLRNEIVTQS